MTNTTSSISTIPPGFAAMGWHRARCIQYIQIGTIQIINEKWQHQVRIGWELPYELRPYDKNNPSQLSPKMVSRDYASSLYNKSWLKKHLQQWMGAEIIEELQNRQKKGLAFDPYMILSQPCQIKIEHRCNPATQMWYEDVVDVFALKNEEVINNFAPQVNDNRVLTFDEWRQSTFESLPNFIKNKIMRSKEYIKLFGTSDQYYDLDPADATASNDEPLPF